MKVTIHPTAEGLPCFLLGNPFDHRYYALLETTLPEFEFYYALLSTDGGESVVQPFFIARQDLFEGLPGRWKRGIARLRKLWPRFGMTRLLMVGNAVGEGSLETARAEEIGTILKAVENFAGEKGISLLLLKEIPSDYRLLLRFTEKLGYHRVASMPGASLMLDFSTFEEYLTTRLSRSMRKNLRRKFRIAEAAGRWEMRVVNRIDPWLEKIHALYTQTRNRSAYRFENLTHDYFRKLGETMGDRARFFLWHLDGDLVAFALCWEHEGTLYDLNLGLDYRCALQYHLYFHTWRDIIAWALSRGLRKYHTGPLNYEPKLHLKLALEPVDLYVKHRSHFVGLLLKIALGWLAPTRYDPVLSRFPNASSLH